MLREPEAGRGGSQTDAPPVHPRAPASLSRHPINHFPLVEDAPDSLLLCGGGIGVTPMIADAHRLHALWSEKCRF